MLEAGAMDAKELGNVLRRITDEALRAGGIVNRLKDLVRRRGSERRVCDVNELIRDLEHLASVDARLHNVRLRLRLSRSLPPVLVDGVQIQQVVLNLIRNGVDAIEGCDPRKRDVVVRTALRSDREIEVSVADTGCGLPPGSEKKIFQPFFTTKQEGIGMGLSVSRSIVAAHGGRLWFSRNSEAGTTFVFTIPATAGDNHA